MICIHKSWWRHYKRFSHLWYLFLWVWWFHAHVCVYYGVCLFDMVRNTLYYTFWFLFLHEQVTFMKTFVKILVPYLSRLPWIFPGAPLKFNGAPGNIQGKATGLWSEENKKRMPSFSPILLAAVAIFPECQTMSAEMCPEEQRRILLIGDRFSLLDSWRKTWGIQTMTASWHGDACRITGHLWGESTDHQTHR